MISRIEAATRVFPEPHRDLSYWHFHLPVRQDFIDSRKTAFGVRRLCIQTLINRAYHLTQIANPTRETRVLVAVTLPELWQSQIIVFFGPDYFNKFLERNTNPRHWMPLESSIWLRERNLSLPGEFSLHGYLSKPSEAITIEKESPLGHQVWFIGQLEN